MAYEISLSSLKEAIHFARFGRNGDQNERMYWPMFKEGFPNCELFWRTFVVPTSKRIELKTGELGSYCGMLVTVGVRRLAAVG
jgi:hypothetical protein